MSSASPPSSGKSSKPSSSSSSASSPPHPNPHPPSVSTSETKTEEELIAEIDSDNEGVVSPSHRSPLVDLYVNEPLHMVDWGGWGTADWTQLKIRGPHYYLNSEKIRARRPVFKLVHADVISGQDRIFHIGKQSNMFIDKWYQNKNKSKGSGSDEKTPSASPTSSPSTSPSTTPSSPTSASSSSSPSSSPSSEDAKNLRIYDDDFFFIVNFLVPSTPSYNVVCYFQRTEKHDASASMKSNPSSESFQVSSAGQYAHDLDKNAVHSFDLLLRRFTSNNDQFRNNRLKIIVNLVDGGNWVVKRAIGNKPAILGNKITTTYHHSVARNYFECDVDIGSSKVGSGIFKIVKGYAKSLTVDMSFLLEGVEECELPEILIGGIRMYQIDTENAIKVSPTGQIIGNPTKSSSHPSTAHQHSTSRSQNPSDETHEVDGDDEGEEN